MVPSSATWLHVLLFAMKVLCQLEDDEQSADLTRKNNFSGKRRLATATLALTSLLHLQESKRSALSTLWAKRSVSLNARTARTFSQAAAALEPSLRSVLVQDGTIAFAAGILAN